MEVKPVFIIAVLSLAVSVASPLLVYYTYPSSAESLVAIGQGPSEASQLPGFVVGVGSCMMARSGKYVEIRGVFYAGMGHMRGMHGGMGFIVVGNHSIAVMLHGCWVVDNSGTRVGGWYLSRLLNGRRVVVEGYSVRGGWGPMIVPVEIHSGGHVYSRCP